MTNKSQNARLTEDQKNLYQENGYIILRQVFSTTECQDFVGHMEDLENGKKDLEQFGQQSTYGFRTFNQHLYDPWALNFLIHPRLAKPLADCMGDEAEAIQTMHFYQGSEHPRHQDQYYLPDCMSAWIAMVDVTDKNGPLCVQPGSHRGRLITKRDVSMEFSSGETYEDQQANRYFPAVEKVFMENGVKEIELQANQGDVVLFNGRLIHGGAKVKEPGSPRHALACHYIPYHSENWDRDWPRIGFNGTRRIHFQN